MVERLQLFLLYGVEMRSGIAFRFSASEALVTLLILLRSSPTTHLERIDIFLLLIRFQWSCMKSHHPNGLKGFYVSPKMGTE